MTCEPRRYALVGCGKSKLGRTVPARELYTGPLFQAALAAAEAEFGADVWVLSAKYDLTDPDEVLEPYDLALGDTDEEYRETWARKVILNLTDGDDSTSPAHLTVYAGAAYVDALRAQLPKTWTLVDPMKGLGQGERLAWLKARRAALTATPDAANSAASSPSAGPRASPLVLRMSNAIPTTLNHAQRGEAFMAALALEDGLKELEALKARLLAGLEAKAETLRQEHARLMRAATTGKNPEAPEQRALPLAEPAPAASEQTKASPGKDETPPPEPPKGTRRSRARTSASAETGAKRAAAGSARTASTTHATASQSPEPDDAVPAPRVVCCECGDAVADHQDGTGRCLRKTKGGYCKCKRFTPMAIALPGAPGWKVRPHKGQLSTGKGGEVAYTLLGDGMETHPLWWVPRYGLAFQNGESVSAVYSYLGETATTLTYEKDPRWHWVPRKALRALAEYMGATWPEKREESADAAALAGGEDLSRIIDATADHPCECDGCGETFKASELQPVGEGESRGFYCAPCRAEVDDFDGGTDAPPQENRDDTLRRAEEIPELDDPFTTPATDGDAAPAFHALDLTALHVVLGEPPAGFHRTYSVLVAGNSPRACEACGTRERPRAHISFNHEDRKSKRSEYTGGGGFAMSLCLKHCTVEGVERAWRNRAHHVERDRLARQQAADAQTSIQVATAPKDLFGRPWPAIDEARFPGWFVSVVPGWCGPADSISAGRLHELYLGLDVKGPEGVELRHLRWFPAAEGGRGDLCVGPHTEPREFALAALPPGLYAALISHLSAHWPMLEETKRASEKVTSQPPSKPKKSRARKPKATPAPPPPAPEASAVPAAVAIAWRVELPKRNEGHTIIRLWLVNDTTSERKPATWWSGVSSLRRSHHLSGKLEGEELAAHLELESWWMANADTVIAPLAQACREGRVPGLKVYEPETLGAGPHKYALSGGWTLEAWEGEGEEAEPSARFTRPAAGDDKALRIGPFVLGMQGQLTTAYTEPADWSAENEAVVAEAESFIARGFIFEMSQGVAS